MNEATPTGHNRTLSPDELVLISNLKLDMGGFLLTYLGQVRQHVSRQRAEQMKIMGLANRAEINPAEAEKYGVTIGLDRYARDSRGNAGLTMPEVVMLSDQAKAEIARIDAAQPERWIALANTHFQQGLMALVRAVAQPEGF